MENELGDLQIHDDVLIPTSSQRVAATRYSPTDVEGELPAVMMAIPYRKDDRITFGKYDPSLRYIAKHGYEVVAIDLPGTGLSGGTKLEPFDGSEGEQLAEVIHWLADQDWCDGQVGMFGKSYGGWTQLKAAEQQPEPLKAIIPVSIVASAYDSSNPGGVFNLLRRGMWGTQMLASKALPPSRRDSDGRWAEVWRRRLDDLSNNEPWLFQFLSHEEAGDYWTDKQIDVTKIDVPTLAVCGYRDIHTKSMVEYFEQIDAPKRLLLGPWRHTIPQRGREVAIDFRRQAVDWFDRFLKGDRNGSLDRPKISYWTERDGGWQINGGEWRATESWPTTENDDPRLTFSLSPSGLRRDENYTTGVVEENYEYDHTVGVNSQERIGHSISEVVDTSPDDARSLVFETDQLERPVEFTGTAKAVLRMRTSTSDPVVAVRVNDVDPDGTARPVTSGYLRASRGNSDRASVASDDGSSISVPLKPRSHVFERGHKIRLAVSAAHFPRTLPPREHGSFSLRSTPEDPSVVVLPGRTREPGFEFADTVSMNAPDDEIVPVASRHIVDSRGNTEVTRDPNNNSATFESSTEYSVDLPHGARLTWKHDVEAGVQAHDPNSAYANNTVELHLEYDCEEVRVTTSSRISRDIAAISTEVSVDDQLMFDKIWRNDQLM